ncbi:MAG TPA: cation-translocating P-type ATPase [Anaerolineaceae bacterium]|nr:cation-translocating P-type ATPase [Anaerolineaceae bacterium]
MTTMSAMETNTKHEKFSGLSEDQVIERRREFGENVLPAEKTTRWWAILFNQLKSPLVYIILAAALISLVVGEYGDFGIIMVVVVADVILGFVQEYQAQNTYLALKNLLKPTTTVIRMRAGGPERKEIQVRELVPGDLVLINAGEKVPGDGIILEGTKLAVDESILTGESEPVNKNAVANLECPGTESKTFMGTTVLTGHGLMQVTSTGQHTELGQIAASLDASIEEDTPLQVRLKAFSKSLTVIVIVFTLAILITGLVMGREFFDMLRTSIILAIAAVPEGLLIAVTVILVLGMRKILKRNGLVKRLLAVETLGSVTTICTDKTGTLTEGRMRVNHIHFADQERALETMILCNNLEGPVDIALWEYAQTHVGGQAQDLFDGSERLAEELFSSETKFMITGNRCNGHGEFNYLKGAPEIVLGMCRMEPAEKSHILAEIDEWAGQGLRLLGLAYRPLGPLEDHSGYEWVGLLGMEDPIREGVVDSIKVAQRAGIRVSMITGDYRRTAEHIGLNIGLFRDGDRIIDGDDLAQMDDAQLQREVSHVAVFARIRPNDKLRIVKALQSGGQVTAMIGDGVNDAPALKCANIGVVVDSATDVAKETADLVLLDSNFRTVVAAVEEGRTIFKNIRKVVAYTLSNSFAEVLTIFIAMVLGWPAPLAVAQILWIHLICDGPSDIVLGFEPKEKGIMEEPPKAKDAPILTRLGYSLIGVISIASTICALLIFNHFSAIHQSPIEGRSIVFASFGINSMIYIFAYRSMNHPLWQMAPLRENLWLVWTVAAGLATVLIAFLIPGLRELLGLVPLSLLEWLVVVGIALILLVVVEIGKIIANRVQDHD